MSVRPANLDCFPELVFSRRRFHGVASFPKQRYERVARFRPSWISRDHRSESRLRLIVLLETFFEERRDEQVFLQPPAEQAFREFRIDFHRPLLQKPQRFVSRPAGLEFGRRPDSSASSRAVHSPGRFGRIDDRSILFPGGGVFRFGRAVRGRSLCRLGRFLSRRAFANSGLNYREGKPHGKPRGAAAAALAAFAVCW